MRRPARHASAGEQRGEQVLGDVEHRVDEARVHIHVGAHVLLGALLAQNDLGRQALDRLEQAELCLVFGPLGHLGREFLEDDGTRIGHGVDRMPHAVHQAGAIVGLLADDLGQVVGNLAVVLPIGDVLLDLALHRAHLVVGAAVLATLQRADRRRVRRIRIGVGGGEHACGERRIVAAAMLGVQAQHDVEHARLLVGELAVGAQHRQDGLGGGLPRDEAVHDHRLVVELRAHRVVREHHDARQARDQRDRRIDLVDDVAILRVLVVGVEQQHRAR